MLSIGASCDGELIGPASDPLLGSDGGVIDSAFGGRDGGLPRWDREKRPPDLKKAKPDQKRPRDLGKPKPDIKKPKKDQFVPKKDKFVPKKDQFVPKKDKFVPKKDKFVPKPDQGNPPPTGGTVYYVRPNGGTSSQCTGKVNAPYPGSGSGKPCAFAHPFWAMPPGKTPILKSGDTLFIAAGSYRMGYGASGATQNKNTCDKWYPWGCVMPKIPSGKSKSAPTRILGEGWDKGCKAPPELWGAERAWRIFDLRGSSNVEIACFDVTDHSDCIDSHTGGLACKKSSYPYGAWTMIGIQAEDSSEVKLKDLDIHGFAHVGIWAGRLSNWTLERVRIAGNGWVGWDGDLSQSKGSSNSGQMTFKSVTIEWNGCSETYPGKKNKGCWAQSANGYGDGLGTAATAGNWLFEDCKILYNTSDGLDLLYHDKGGSVTIRRMHAEGNAGNQVKVTGNTTIENSLIVGNCSYFNGKSFTYKVDPCRSLGNPVSIEFQKGTKAVLVNSTIKGESDVLLESGVRNSSCNGTESYTVINNIFIGDTDYYQPFEKTNLFYQQGCGGLKLSGDYNIHYNLKTACPKVGNNDLCTNPKLGSIAKNSFKPTPQSGSPAINSGKAVGGVVPKNDLYKKSRPCGGKVDRGAIEVCP